MKPLIPHILFLFGLISLQASCQKSEPKPLILNDPEFLSYWFFPAGSYWIYEDSLSGTLDTFKISSTDIQQQNNRYGDNILQEHIIRLIHQGKLSTQVGMPWPYSKNDEGIYDLDERTDQYSFFRFFYTKDLSSPYVTTNQTLHKTIFDSFVVKDRTYYSVHKIENKSILAYDTLQFEYYAKNVGIIKKVYRGIRVWELKEYYISQ